jgi:hypothetical protein
MVLPKIHQCFLKLFGAKFFKPERMANRMESTRQEAFTQLGTLLPIVAVLFFILMLYPAPSAVGQYNVALFTDDDKTKFLGNGITSIIGLVGINAPETSKKKNEPGQSLSQKSIKHLASHVLNKSVDISLPF